MRSAGARPKSSPVTTAIARVKASTRQSTAKRIHRGISSGRNRGATPTIGHGAPLMLLQLPADPGILGLGPHREHVGPVDDRAEGMVHVPLQKPSIGVEVDRERIEALTVRSEELRPVRNA